jgi:hypothetical protein
MKERPILFSGPMVRALLAGTKTQTRRAIKAVAPTGEVRWSDHNPGWWHVHNDPIHNTWSRLKCPYGDPGDRLWVREACFTDDERRIALYAADGYLAVAHYKRRNYIHMPRWACRLVLEVTGIRVERLRAIGVENAIAEGLLRHNGEVETWWGNGREGGAPHLNTCRWLSPVECYRDLWESINGAGSWTINPWVWVVEFKPCPSESGAR